MPDNTDTSSEESAPAESDANASTEDSQPVDGTSSATLQTGNTNGNNTNGHGHHPGKPGKPGKPGSQSQSSGSAPADGDQNSNAPADGNQNANAPTDGNQNGSAPAQGTQPMDGNQQPGQAPGLVSFEALLQNGVITQETYDAIMAYMQQNQPAEAQNGAVPPALPEGDTNGNPPVLPEGSDNGNPPTLPDNADGSMVPPVNGLLQDLMTAGVLTQEQVDAITAWMATQAPATAAEETAADTAST